MFDIQPAKANAAPPVWPEGGHVPLSTDLSGILRVTNVGGGGGAVTIVDGGDVVEGSTTDAAVTTDANGTLSAKLRGIIVILLRMFNLATPVRNQQVGINTSEIVDAGGNGVTVTGNKLDVNAAVTIPANQSVNVNQVGGNAALSASVASNVIALTSTTVPVQLSTVSCSEILIQADLDNVPDALVGSAAVQAYRLPPGANTGWVKVVNWNVFWGLAKAAGTCNLNILSRS
jgi:hypothetical protein